MDEEVCVTLCLSVRCSRLCVCVCVCVAQARLRSKLENRLRSLENRAGALDRVRAKIHTTLVHGATMPNDGF